MHTLKHPDLFADRHDLPSDLCSKDEEKQRHAAAVVGAEFERKMSTLAASPAWEKNSRGELPPPKPPGPGPRAPGPGLF